MTEPIEPNFDPPADAAAEIPAAPDAVGDDKPAAETPPSASPAAPPPTGAADSAPKIEPTPNASADAAPEVEPPRGDLISYRAAPRARAAGLSPTAKWAAGVAASLALVAAVAAAGLYDHARQANALAAEAHDSRALAQTVKSLKERLDAVEAARARDESADLRKAFAELKAQSGAARDLNGALAQLTARVDRIEHDQGGRLDKLADRLDHETTARVADLVQRVDKLEKRPAAPVVATVPAPAPKPTPAAAPAGKPAAVAPKADLGVSDEVTGSIVDRRQAPLRGYWLVDVEHGYAFIDGRDGPRQIAPGDFLPGVGRVQGIERRGRQWVVVTSAGIIASDPTPF
jgi:hypothetical protein